MALERAFVSAMQPRMPGQRQRMAEPMFEAGRRQSRLPANVSAARLPALRTHARVQFCGNNHGPSNADRSSRSRLRGGIGT